MPDAFEVSGQIINLKSSRQKRREVEGFRAGKKTESLKDTYFSFTSDKMSTNLPIRGATDSPYSRKENIISQTVINDLTIDYTIQELTEHRLQLTTNLRGLEFVFILEKELPEE